MKTDLDQESNSYDRILKEGALRILYGLIDPMLFPGIKEAKALPEKFQSTQEREVDAVFKVTLMDGTECLIHIEFQTSGDRKMIYRFGEYHAMLQKIYEKEIRHFLIYLGKSPPRMKDQLPPEQIFRGFTMIDLGRMEPSALLDSREPEVIILAMLTGYPKEQTEEVLRSMIQRLLRSATNPILLGKYISHVLYLAGLRKLDQMTLTLIEEIMPVQINIEDHVLYRRGLDKGIEKGIEKGIDQGAEKSRVEMILIGHRNGISIELLSKQTGWAVERVKEIIKSHSD